jgi:hypothetical protein
MRGSGAGGGGGIVWCVFRLWLRLRGGVKGEEFGNQGRKG